MDTTSNPPSEPAADQEEPELIYLYGSTEFNGLTYGSPLNVPEGYSALAVIGDKPLDVVGPGDYTIDAAYFPELVKALKVRPGEAPTKGIKWAIYFLNVTAAALTWRAIPTVTRNRQYGLTYCDLRGHCTVRVSNPATFFTAFKRSFARLLKQERAATRAQLAAAPPGRQAEVLVLRTINSASGIGMAELKLAPEQAASSITTILQMVGGASAAALQAMGIECTSFNITVQPETYRAPCSKCGSPTALTGYGVYRRTISLLYLRFGVKREGNFCVPCAAKISAAYNGTMLVCGWWGYIGIVLTPIYLVQNCYHFLNCAFGPKAASGVIATAPETESAWPPAPSVDWGNEVQEQ